MNEIRTIKLLMYQPLAHCVNTQQQLPLLDNKASQYLPFMLKNSSCSTTWEQHCFCIESPVLRSSNHFQDSISPVLRISLGGKEAASIVIGSILHTVKTRQAEVKWFFLGQVWVRDWAIRKNFFIPRPLFYSLDIVFRVWEVYRSCLIQKCLQWGEHFVFWVRCHVTDVETGMWIQNSTHHSCNWWGQIIGGVPIGISLLPKI